MKTLKIKHLLLVCLGLLAFASCQVEPDFPLPGFTDGSREVSFRRDTVPTTYDITFGMSLSAEVASIEVIDGYNNEHLDWINDHNGSTDFNLSYSIDLTKISSENDTVLYRKFRIVDSRDAAYNRMCKMIIKKLSRPEVVGMTEGSTVAIQGDIFKPSGTAATGMIALKSIEYLFGEESLYKQEFTGDSLIYEHSLSKGVALADYNIEKGTLYPFSVVVTDANDRSEKTTVNLSLVPALLPSKILWDNGKNYAHEILIATDEQDRISEITVRYANSTTGEFTDYLFLLEYNELGQVVSFNRDGSSTYTNKFEYDADGKLSSAFYRKSQREITDFTYDEKGLMTSIYHYNKTMTFPYTTDPLDIDLPLFSCYWGNRGPYYLTRMSQITEFYSVFVPTFIEELPPFFELGNTRSAPIYDLFTNRLLPAKVEIPEGLDGTGSKSEEGIFTYTTNEDGTIDKIVRNFVSGIDTYTFVYGEEVAE